MNDVLLEFVGAAAVLPYSLLINCFLRGIRCLLEIGGNWPEDRLEEVD